MNQQRFNTVTQGKIQTVLKKAAAKISTLTNMKVLLTVEFVPEIIVQEDSTVDLLKINNIFKAVAAVTGVNQAKIVSESRKKQYVRARQMTYHFVRKRLSHLTYKNIGQIIGGRDHSSVMHGLDKCEDYIETEAEYRAEVEKIQQILDNN